ncbi:hypothetical protein IWZ00DRAFT_10706 [Phyllosticta capitalensis]
MREGSRASRASAITSAVTSSLSLAREWTKAVRKVGQVTHWTATSSSSKLHQVGSSQKEWASSHFIAAAQYSMLRLGSGGNAAEASQTYRSGQEGAWRGQGEKTKVQPHPFLPLPTPTHILLSNPPPKTPVVAHPIPRPNEDTLAPSFLCSLIRCFARLRTEKHETGRQGRPPTHAPCVVSCRWLRRNNATRR